MSKTLIPAQRRKRIQDFLAIHKIVPSSQLRDLLEVSEATIRRDLEWMENEGLVERTHGGAILRRRIQVEPEYNLRAQRYTQEKHLIGATAATLIEDGDIVFINSGTTTTQVIQNIPKNLNVTVITNNLSAALEIGDPGYEIFLLGGSFQPKSHSVAGRFAIENLRQVYANKAFLGVDGLSLQFGCTVPSNEEAEVIRLMVERTHGPITVVADHSKWGIVSNFEVATVERVHRLVTDENFSPRARAALAAQSVEIIIARTR